MLHEKYACPPDIVDAVVAQSQKGRQVLVLGGDATPLRLALDELSRLGADGRLQLELDRSPKFRQLVVDGFFDSDQLARVDCNLPAAGAVDALVSFHPSDLLLELLAALRAGDGDDGVVEIDGHGRSFSGGLMT